MPPRTMSYRPSSDIVPHQEMVDDKVVVLTANAEHSLAIRNIDSDGFVETLKHTDLVKRDETSGYFIYTVSGLKVVGKEVGKTIRILTVVADDEVATG